MADAASEAILGDDTQVKVAANAAADFVESYYTALNNIAGRARLATYYIKSTPASPSKADISLNGTIIEDPVAFQDLFENRMEKSLYEVGSFDCHVLNTNWNVGAAKDALGPNKDGKKMSIVVMISGSVKYWQEDGEGEADTKGFTESIVLIPNLAALGPKAAKGERKWLIQSQNFRIVT